LVIEPNERKYTLHTWLWGLEAMAVQMLFFSMENPNPFVWEGQNLLHNKIGGTSAE
jgi:hypothetical protein